MASTYTGVAGNVSASSGPQLTIPADGDLANASSVNTAIQKADDFLALIMTTLTSAYWFGGASTTADTTARFARPGFSSAAIDTVEVQVPAPAAGLLSKMYVKCTTGSTTQGWTVFVRKNGSNTTITATVAAAATIANDTTHSVAVVAGDLLSVSVTGVAGITVAPVNFLISFLYTMA